MGNEDEYSDEIDGVEEEEDEDLQEVHGKSQQNGKHNNKRSSHSHHNKSGEDDQEDEEDDDDDENDDYQKDDFVVTDQEDDLDEEEEDEDDEKAQKRKERHRRKKEERRQRKLQQQQQQGHKRVLKKVQKTQPSEESEEHEEVEQLEEYHDGSEVDEDEDRNYNQKKQQNRNQAAAGNKRLKNNQYEMEVEGEDGEEQDLEDYDDEEQEGNIVNRMGKQTSAFQDLFIDEEELDDEPENEEEEEHSEIDQKPDLKKFLELDDIKNRYERDEDRKIKDEDIPERLQLRMVGRRLPDPQEFLDETKWIFENLRAKEKRFNDPQYQKRIFQFLEALHINMEEVMYIYTYRKNDFHPHFSLADLWRLYDLDQEWGVFIKQKSLILQQMQRVSKEIDYIPILINNLIIDMEQLRRAEDFFYRATDLQSLKFVKDYYDYLLVKIYSVKEQKAEKIRKERKSRMINTYIECNVHQQAASVSLPPYELVKNLEENAFIFMPQVQMNKPQQFADTLLKINPNKTCMKCPLDALECMADYQSNEMYYFPPLKKWVFENYKQKVSISTMPTELGKKQIDIFNRLYPAKRINKRKFQTFSQDTWLLVEEAERQNLITVKFQLERKENKSSGNNNEKSNDLMDLMNQFYLVQLKNLEQPVKSTNLEWNIFRKYNIEHVLEKYFIPHMQTLVRSELHDNAEKWVIAQCAQKFLNMINVEPEKNGSQLHKIMSVVQDQNNKIGVVFVEESGIPKDSMILNYFMKREEHLVTKAREEKRIEEQNLDALIDKFRPTVAIVAANSIESQVLKNKLHSKLFPQYGDDTIPQIISKQPPNISNSLYKDQVLTVALSQARMLLNPTAEILSLWNERTELNGCLHIPLHPSKEFVSLEKLKNALEKCCVQIVNLIGVEFDMFHAQPHLKHLLQHVCGLGPRKAMKMLDMLQKNLDKDGFNDIDTNRKRHDTIVSRRQTLVTHFEVKPLVYKNMNGFVRFRFSNDPFERTRINKEYYKIAKKICKESIDSHTNQKKSEEEQLKHAMDNPKLIESIDLDDYANQLFEKKNQPNMKPVLDFIKDELVNNFYYKREPYRPISSEDLFFKMIKENPQTFRKGMIVSAKVVTILEPQENMRTTKLHVRILDNDLKSSIIVPSHESMNFKVGDIIKAYIDKVHVVEPKPKRDNMGGPSDKFDKFDQSDLKGVTLTFKDQYNDIYKDSHPCFKDPAIFSTFTFEEDEDKPIGIEVTTKKVRKFEPRKIAHPNFKNISLSYAVKLLKNASNGEFIIRPSSKGKNHLAISWKFFEDVFVHLSLREDTQHGDKFHTKLVLDGNKDSFDNFDEVIERYIIPCNNHMNVVKDHRKFTRNSIEEIEKDLKKSKEELPDTIHYAFCCVPKYPQCIVLLYCSRKDTVTKEWIRVKHQGLQFHHQYFAQFKELILWFKSNFHTSDYKRHVTKIEDLNTPKTPLYGGNSSYGGGSSYMNQGVKLENGTKNEKFENGRNLNLRCQNCQKFGHSANMCKNKKGFPPTQGNPGPRQCYHCKSSDHLAKECPTRSQMGGNSTHFERRQNFGNGSDRRDRIHSRSRSRSYDKNI